MKGSFNRAKLTTANEAKRKMAKQKQKHSKYCKCEYIVQLYKVKVRNRKYVITIGI